MAKFTIKTEKGSEIKVDTDLVSGFEIEIDGEIYDISITKQ